MTPAQIADATETELTRSLIASVVPALVMSASFIGGGALIVATAGDTLLTILWVMGVSACIARLFATRIVLPRTRQADFSINDARRCKIIYGIPYLGFATILGLFGFRCITLPIADAHMLMVGMIVGFGAGAAMSKGLIPQLSRPALLISFAPTVAALMAGPSYLYQGTAALVATLAITGLQAIGARHGRAVNEIHLRLNSANLTRHDALTDLPNRLALREHYDIFRAAPKNERLAAVHYLDLNGFKPVNDQFGHAVGDELLVAVGKRISRILRTSDMVARLGGDEFAVLQCGISDARDARQLASRISEVIGNPYRIREHDIEISTSIGFVIANAREDLDHLLSCADRALYECKRGRQQAVLFRENFLEEAQQSMPDWHAPKSAAC